MQLRFIPPADAKLALTQGSVDAWATWEPYTALAETSGHARVLVNGRGLWTGLSYLAATDAALAEKAAVLQDFKERVERAQVWSYKNAKPFGRRWRASSASPPMPRSCSSSAAPRAGRTSTPR